VGKPKAEAAEKDSTRMISTTRQVSIITADWHLDNQTRNEYRHTFVEKALPELIKTYRYHRLVLLGDLCQDKDRHNAELVNRVVESITQLAKLCEVIILRGNHDYIDPGNPFFAFLEKLRVDVTWISKPTFIANELFLPHTRDHWRDWKGLDFKKASRIFAHQTFAGAQAGNHVLDGIALSVFPENVDVISGDVHVPQKIKNLRYVGAPYTINFGDNYKPRVLILRDGKLTTLPVSGPQKVLVEIDDVKELPTLNKGDMVKVRVALDKFEDFRLVQKTTLEWAQRHGYSLHAVQPIINSHRTKNRKAANTTVKTDADHVRAYATKVGVSAEVLSTGLKFTE
jgi:DNA repair exonuclease SbcCD nuclease subunit